MSNKAVKHSEVKDKSVVTTVNGDASKPAAAKKDFGGTGRLLKEYDHGNFLLWAVAMFCAIGNGAMMPLFAVFFQQIIENLTQSANEDIVDQALRIMVYFIAMGAGMLVFLGGQIYFWSWYGAKITTNIRKEFMTVLLTQDITYHDLESSSKLNVMLSTECTAIEAGIGDKKGFCYSQIGSAIAAFVFAFLYSWELTLILLATVPLMMFLGFLQAKAFSNTSQRSDPYSVSATFTQEALTNIKTVLAFPTLAKASEDKLGEELMKAKPVVVKRLMIAGMGFGAFISLLFVVMYPAMLYFGAWLMEAGKLNLADLFGCFFSFFIGGMALGQMGSALGDMMKANIAANKLYSVIERTPEIRPIKKLVEKSKLEGSIEFKDVVFSYKTKKHGESDKKTDEKKSDDKKNNNNKDEKKYDDGDDYEIEEVEVLKKVSFSIKSGQTLAVVGPSGSGKSTIISLLERFYDPNEGEIYIDGELIHNYKMDFLRENIGFVSQLPLLFDASVEENIRGGNDEAKFEEVVEAAKMAMAHEFIEEMSDGYKTGVGELGDRISGGQRQRIAIARAILAKPAILLLDEATASLDSKSEAEVQKAIDHIAEKHSQTIVTVAHRLSTIQGADKIIVIVDGTVEEVGNNKSLMELGGVYASLVKSQKLVDERSKA